MYKINKIGLLSKLYVRGIFFSKKFILKNKKRSTVYLRSPKHFNIGKHKVFSFNNRHYELYTLNLKAPLNLLFNNNLFVFKILNPFFNFNLLFRINSIKVSLRTKIMF